MGQFSVDHYLNLWMFSGDSIYLSMLILATDFSLKRKVPRNSATTISIKNKYYLSLKTKSFHTSPVIIPVVVYNNADIQKKQILSENKEKVGIYMWKNLRNGKRYVGSSVDIRDRMYSYYNAKYLTSQKSMHICSALLEYGYSSFSLEILEYCAREDCITREDYYITLLKPEYNVAIYASAPMLGRYHSADTKKLLSAINKGVARSEEAKRSISEGSKGRIHTEATKKKISATKLASKTKLSEETKEKISEKLRGKMRVVKRIPVEVLNKNTGETTIYATGKEAAIALSCSASTVSIYIKSGKLFKGIFKMSYKL